MNDQTNNQTTSETNTTNEQTAPAAKAAPKKRAKTKKDSTGLTANQKKAVNKLPTKSAKIRYLTNLKWSRSQIATFLNIRYQHVRNVQITPVGKAK